MSWWRSVFEIIILKTTFFVCFEGAYLWALLNTASTGTSKASNVMQNSVLTTLCQFSIYCKCVYWECICVGMCLRVCYNFVWEECLNASICAADRSTAYIEFVDISKCFYFVPHLSNFFCLCTVCSNCRALLLFFSCTRLLHTYNCAAAATAFLHHLRSCSDM